MIYIRWKIYKALCWIAWRICPHLQRDELQQVWDAGLQQHIGRFAASKSE